MELNKIISLIERYTNELYVAGSDNNIETALPDMLANNLLLIRGLLVQLIDKVAESELEYRNTKSSRYDKLIAEGMKKSPAFDQLEMEKDLIQMKISTERVRNYLKYTDGLCTSIQSVLKFKTSTNT